MAAMKIMRLVLIGSVLTMLVQATLAGKMLGGDDQAANLHETTAKVYGSTAPVEFVAHTNKEQQPSEVAALFAQPQMMRAGLSKMPRLRLEGLTVERNRVQG